MEVGRKAHDIAQTVWTLLHNGILLKVYVYFFYLCAHMLAS